MSRVKLLYAVILWLALARAAHADKALVVGIDQYPRIPGANLKGCVNDARSMKQALERCGFQVRLVTNAGASRQGILDAFKAMATTCNPGERFAFVFAGHGTGPQPATILTYDSVKDTASMDITVEELNRAILSVPAASRVAFLDSCFSGAMARSIRRLGRVGMRSRFFKRAKDIVVARVNQQDSNDHLDVTGKVCYFAAARPNEEAQEDVFKGASHGIFSYFLSMELQPGSSWMALQGKVGASVSNHVADQQHPTLSPAFSSLPVFATSGPPAASSLSSNLWEIFNRDRVDRSRLEITMQPNTTSVRVNEEGFRFSTRVEDTGYLVIVEHGVSGRINLLFPRDGNVQSAYVLAGQTVSFPVDPDEECFANTQGHERVRAMLFSASDVPDRIIKAVLDSNGSGADAGSGYEDLVRRMKRDIVTRPVGQSIPPFYTSDIVFEVGP